ncbi:MAG: class I SAM-dependent methyltransferase [Robiginitomaculum sp.]|nr:class I SAM-dependent methyltransferase [Robiginitomaculum sp.]MDQ7077593.1 class I SAM-dependent methyltransferase [Robiginitomaculum sp.]
MSAAGQHNLRKPDISVESFRLIIKKYLRRSAFKNKRILDIGPGQCDFLDMAKKAGADRTYGCDFDPAVGALGKLRGHDMTIANLKQGWPYKGEVFDGIFCRGSLNCCWFSSEERLAAFLDDMAASLSPDGWIWIAPWNNPVPGKEDFLEVVHRVSKEWADKNAIRIEIPSPRKREKYGLIYSIPRIEIWRRK